MQNEIYHRFSSFLISLKQLGIYNSQNNFKTVSNAGLQKYQKLALLIHVEIEQRYGIEAIPNAICFTYVFVVFKLRYH